MGLLHRVKERRGIARLELPDLDTWRDFALKGHVPAGICGLRDFAIAGSSGVSGCA